MPCYYPLTAYQDANGTVVFVERGAHDFVRTLQLPCGQCVGCRLERSRQWAVRCVHEAQLHRENSFITLTYRDMPENASLSYRDFQLFMKRLRKNGHQGARFFMCGEYGDDFGRPHFHACLFNCGFADKELHMTTGSGMRIYRSKELEKLWTLGFSSIGDVTFQSAAYVARYVMKKITGEDALEHYGKRVAEFCHMSLKPGIGAGWIDRYMTDVYPEGFVVVNGVKIRPPKYYDKKIKKRDDDEWARQVMMREKRAHETFADNTEERLEVKRKVTIAKIGFLKRGSV